MQNYLTFLQHILEQGQPKEDRTNISTLSYFGYQMRFDLTQGFPLLTTKALHLKSIVEELLWFLRGETNIRSLNEQGVRIWNEWADTEGNLGPIYGKQWRAWNTGQDTIDQISQVIEQIKTNPNSRRHIVSAWNVGELEQMALAPCHTLFQFYVTGKHISCQLYQRSADVFLGVPFNIASYALLTHIIAQQCDLIAKEFIWTGGDCHLYLNHQEQAKLQLSRKPRTLPKLVIHRKPPNPFEYRFEDFEFLNYDPYPAIKAPIAV